MYIYTFNNLALLSSRFPLGLVYIFPCVHMSNWFVCAHLVLRGVKCSAWESRVWPSGKLEQHQQEGDNNKPVTRTHLRPNEIDRSLSRRVCVNDPSFSSISSWDGGNNNILKKINRKNEWQTPNTRNKK